MVVAWKNNDMTSPARAKTTIKLSTIDKFSAAFISALFYWKITPQRMSITIPRAPAQRRPIINHQLIFNWITATTARETRAMGKVSRRSVKWADFRKLASMQFIVESQRRQWIESEDRSINKCFPCLESLKVPSRHSIIGELRSNK